MCIKGMALKLLLVEECLLMSVASSPENPLGNFQSFPGMCNRSLRGEVSVNDRQRTEYESVGA
jgi:hypothetical protein